MLAQRARGTTVPLSGQAARSRALRCRGGRELRRGYILLSSINAVHVPDRVRGQPNLFGEFFGRPARGFAAPVEHLPEVLFGLERRDGEIDNRGEVGAVR